MPRQARENGHTIARETQPHQARVIKHGIDGCGQRPERQTIARRQPWRQRPVFGTDAMIAGTENDRSEPRRIARG